jgi:hypothetical protein
MCLAETLLVPLEPEIKIFEPFYSEAKWFVLLFGKETKECQKSGRRKRQQNRTTQMHNMGLCEFFVGFLSAEIKLASCKLLQCDIQGDS